MSQSKSAAAGSTHAVRDAAEQNRTKAQQNRAKAQQNRDKGAQNRTISPSNPTLAGGKVRFDDTKPNLPAPQQSKKAAKQGGKSRSASGGASAQFKSKVVIRRLPANLPEGVFWTAVAPWIRDASDCSASTATTTEASGSTPPAAPVPTVDFKHFLAGKVKSDTNKSSKHSRAYVRFLNPTALVAFHKAFDGHIFRDAKGKESVAIVEFAPYQKVVLPTPPSSRAGRRGRADPKQGTISTDPQYLEFVQKLEQSKATSEGELLSGLYDAKEKEKEKQQLKDKAKTTPLLEHLRAQKKAKLESVALLKKARKAAAKQQQQVQVAREEDGSVEKDKSKTKEIGKATKKDRKGGKGKGKATGKGKEKAVESAPQKTAPQTPSKAAEKKKKPEPKAAAEVGGGGEGNSSKPKNKQRPARKPKPPATGSASAPAKVQILKRDP